MTLRNAGVLLAALALAACGGEDRETGEKPQAEQAPGTYRVRLETTKGDIVIEVHRKWAPIGADHFLELTRAGYFDDCPFFRVVPGFVVQWGINSDPAMTRKWADLSIRDDPVRKSNKRWRVTFGTTGRPHSRSTHVFVNLADNRGLDKQGFAPFGEVVEGRDVVEKIYDGYGGSISQPALTMQGRALLEEKYPKIDYIEDATVLE